MAHNIHNNVRSATLPHVDCYARLRASPRVFSELGYRPTCPLAYKRSLLSIGSYIFKGLFETAAEDDLQPIVQHMKRTGQGVSALGGGLQLQQDR